MDSRKILLAIMIAVTIFLVLNLIFKSSKLSKMKVKKMKYKSIFNKKKLSFKADKKKKGYRGRSKEDIERLIAEVSKSQGDSFQNEEPKASEAKKDKKKGGAIKRFLQKEKISFTQLKEKHGGAKSVARDHKVEVMNQGRKFTTRVRGKQSHKIEEETNVEKEEKKEERKKVKAKNPFFKGRVPESQSKRVKENPNKKIIEVNSPNKTRVSKISLGDYKVSKKE